MTDMTPTDLLALLQRSGISVRLADGKLLVSPASRLTDDERQALREHRDGLIAVLSGEAAPALAVGTPTGPKVRWPVAWLL
jgi:hypothetical protein